MPNLGTSETRQESLAVDATATLCQAGYWESRIKTAWANASRHKLYMCSVTAEAKRHLARGEWSRLFKLNEMPFSKRDGEKRVRIWKAMGGLFPHDRAEMEVEERSAANAHDLAQLPDKITVLEVLAALDPAAIKRCLAEGLIHARLSYRKAKELVAELNGQPVPEEAPNVTRRWKRFRRFITDNLPAMNALERKTVVRELNELMAIISPEGE